MIYDCFIFFNELELLKIRLTELYDVVDKFILVESNKTFQGNYKPYYYLENKHLFEQFNDKIIYLNITTFSDKKEDAWNNEDLQRNMIFNGLNNCNPDDIIIVSDVDEIPKQNIIKNYTHFDSFYLDLHFFRYFLNCVSTKIWSRSFITRFKHLKNIHNFKLHNCYNHIPNAGWHFSCCGGTDMLLHKLSSFSHFEESVQQFNNREIIENAIHDLKELFEPMTLQLIDVDDFLPSIILKNIDYYKQIGFIK